MKRIRCKSKQALMSAHKGSNIRIGKHARAAAKRAAKAAR